ncbi:MAG TPA: glycosyltransferase family 4 protein [Flavitalea sp.]|nr:glycosyltransferase family 4 protein [Flavitalea sp.]
MNNVLFIGPEHKNHRGGIGAVIDVYSKHITPFRFIPTYVTGSFFHQCIIYIKAIFRLIWLCFTDRGIRIIHIHHASRGSFLRKSLLALIGKVFGKKIILHIHGGGFHNFYNRAKFLKPFIKWTLESSDAVICLSEMWKKYYSSAFKLKRLVIINNVIEEPDVLPQHVQNGSLNLLFLGHVTEKKGVFDLLNVLAANREHYKHKVKVTIGGVGEDERLKKTISQNEFNGDVNFAGWVNGNKKAELLNSCDVYVLPSYFEGLPISILEAMAYGKPVISTNVGGIPEIVKPGYNGWLFHPGDQEALNNIIREAMDNKELLKQYGNNSLNISKKYTPTSVFQSLNDLYTQILNQ